MHKRSPEVTAFWAHVLVENLSNLVAYLYSLAHVRLSGEEVRAALQNLAREAQEEFLEEW